MSLHGGQPTPLIAAIGTKAQFLANNVYLYPGQIGWTTDTHEYVCADSSNVKYFYPTIKSTEIDSNVTMVENTIYYVNSPSLVTLTLPATFNKFSLFGVIGEGAGGWKVAQQAGQICRLTSTSTTLGVTGSISSANRYDNMFLRAMVADTELSATGRNGSLIVV